MAVLDIGIDTAIVSPVRRTRRLGNLFWLAAGWIVFVAIVSTFAAVLLSHGPLDMDMLERRAAPSLSHWLGTHGLRRDEMAPLGFGPRVSLTLRLCAPILGLPLGGRPRSRAVQ